jgi:hypothetical protein
LRKPGSSSSTKTGADPAFDFASRPDKNGDEIPLQQCRTALVSVENFAGKRAPDVRARFRIEFIEKMWWR